MGDNPRMGTPTFADATPAVAIRHVNYTYSADREHKQVLHDVSLTLKRGEFVILTGPSGAGKTTLLTLIGALRAMQDGSISVLGTELARLNDSGQRNIRRKIGFIFQEHNLFAALTAFQTLWLTTELGPDMLSRADALERAGTLLSSLGMGEYLHALPQALSTGQKQRLAIARALINSPPLILADEPTASLDHALSQLVIELIRRRVKSEGTTALMVTHDTRIFGFADRVVQMVDGQISP